MSAEGRNFEGRGGCPEACPRREILEIGLSETPFSAFPGPDPDFITYVRNELQLYELHK